MSGAQKRPASLADLTDMVVRAQMAFPGHVPDGFEKTLAASGATATQARSQLFQMVTFDPLGIASMKKQLRAQTGIDVNTSAAGKRGSMLAELMRAGLEPRRNAR